MCFTCNHCPYALAWHERIVAVAGDYDFVKPDGVDYFLIFRP